MRYFLFAIAAVSLTVVASVPAYAQESNADLAFAGVPAQVRSGGLLPTVATESCRPPTRCRSGGRKTWRLSSMPRR